MSTQPNGSAAPPAESEVYSHVQPAPPPIGKNGRGGKRIIVCCDGTWQDGFVSKKRWQSTNILKLSRMINHEDDRHHPPVPQVIFYQPGVGTENNLYSEYVDGAFASSLVCKVQEAYGFIASNYHSGDEIYLFGFSRGAYTARMTAALIGEIGVLNKHDMDHFAKIFVAYQQCANTNNTKEAEVAEAFLEPWRSPTAKGRIRADANHNAFTVKCLGVFDTVGSVGLPEELRFSRKMKRLFGFRDKDLGAHVENAFQAMALDERRSDFNVAKFHQTDEGRRKKQVLKQVWFTGCHTDVGGGYQRHDLADITLTWMASNIESMLSLDVDYLLNIPRPVAPTWGTQEPNNSSVGIFRLSYTMQRPLPTESDAITHERVHPSVCSQPTLHPALAAHIAKNPALVCPLAPLEEVVKAEWPHMKGRHGHDAPAVAEGPEGAKHTLLRRARTAVTVTFRSQSMREGGGGAEKPRAAAVHRHSWFGTVVHDITSSF